MGDSSAGHLSREPRQAIEGAPRPIQRSIFGPASDGLLNRQHSADDRAVTGLLRPSQVPLVSASDPPTGSSLDSATRSRMESLLGADFSRVRVHADAESPPGLTPSRVPATRSDMTSTWWGGSTRRIGQMAPGFLRTSLLTSRNRHGEGMAPRLRLPTWLNKRRELRRMRSVITSRSRYDPGPGCAWHARREISSPPSRSSLST